MNTIKQLREILKIRHFDFVRIGAIKQLNCYKIIEYEESTQNKIVEMESEASKLSFLFLAEHIENSEINITMLKQLAENTKNELSIMSKKITRYRLSVSRTFPKGHKKEGEETYFTEKIACKILCPGECDACSYDKSVKLHTIRRNYPEWKKRMQKVQRGEAVIELFYWSRSPYNSKRDGSKQIVFATLDKDSGCGVQELFFYTKDLSKVLVNYNKCVDLKIIAQNDGLSLEDFKEFFKKYDLSQPMAIIHFTDFRY